MNRYEDDDLVLLPDDAEYYEDYGYKDYGYKDYVMEMKIMKMIAIWMVTGEGEKQLVQR